MNDVLLRDGGAPSPDHNKSANADDPFRRCA